jgi:hypothetical protein
VLYFFDTSALVKRYHAEAGTPTVLDCFRDPHHLLLICNLSIAELIAALQRLFRRGEDGWGGAAAGPAAKGGFRQSNVMPYRRLAP